MQLLNQSGSLPEIKVVRYAFFDGDNIGNAIENLLRKGRVKEATHLSESIKLAIFKIELFVKSTNNSELVISGGDDVLISYDPVENETAFLEEIISIFNSFTGLSMSCGVGNSVNQALVNLASVKQGTKGEILRRPEGIEYENNLAKQTKLYIFTKSNRPDPYINVIAHCATEYKYLDQITLVGITEDRGQILSIESDLESIKNSISTRLEELSEGKYPKEVEGQQTLLDIQMKPAARQRYAALKGLTIKLKVLDYRILEKELSSLMSSSTPFEYIFDVTAVSKGYLVDVYTLLRFKNVSAIHTFEIIKEKLYYDERDLIHNLNYGRSYEFPCLSGSLHTERKIVISEDSLTSDSELNRLQSDLQVLECEQDKLENKVATDFAKFWSLSYFAVLLLLIALSYWKIRQSGGWDWLEPTLYIVTSAWFLFNFLLQIVFGGTAPSFDPKSLFFSLREAKKKKLQEDRSPARRR